VTPLEMASCLAKILWKFEDSLLIQAVEPFVSVQDKDEIIAEVKKIKQNPPTMLLSNPSANAESESREPKPKRAKTDDGRLLVVDKPSSPQRTHSDKFLFPSMPLKQLEPSGITMITNGDGTARDTLWAAGDAEKKGILLHRADIWTNDILPFLGPGNYIFVAGISRRFKDLYNIYFSKIENPPEISPFEKSLSYAYNRRDYCTVSTTFTTFYGNVFSYLPTAKFWKDLDSVNGNPFRSQLPSPFGSSFIPEQLRPGRVCALIAKSGNLQVLQWAKAVGFTMNEQTSYLAASAGHLQVLKWARENGCPWEEWTCAHAAEGGHLEVLKWALENACPWNEWTCKCAAGKGHLEVLQWARENGCPWNEDTCSNAAEGGHLEVLKWAHENVCPWDESTCAYAAKRGHLEVLKWAHKNGCPWDEWTCSLAAYGGHMEVLKWAHENGCPWNEMTCEDAAHEGHLEALVYAHTKGCPWDTKTCEMAAYGGHLEVLKWAHDNRCPWSERTCALAARSGHLEVLIYAHENNCPWNEWTCAAAVKGGHLEVLIYAHKNGCPWTGEVLELTVDGVGNNKIAEYARNNGCPTGEPIPDHKRLPHNDLKLR
jgi:hypothetical protein